MPNKKRSNLLNLCVCGGGGDPTVTRSTHTQRVSSCLGHRRIEGVYPLSGFHHVGFSVTS